MTGEDWALDLESEFLRLEPWLQAEPNVETQIRVLQYLGTVLLKNRSAQT